MLFSRQLPLADLIRLCHLVRHNHSAGLTLVAVFRQLAQRSTPRLRPVAERIRVHLESGESLKAALKAEQAYFPPLFRSLATVGEETGRLADMLHVRAGPEVAGGIVQLCIDNGWQGLDLNSGEFLEVFEDLERGLDMWRAYRDRILERM